MLGKKKKVEEFKSEDELKKVLAALPANWNVDKAISKIDKKVNKMMNLAWAVIIFSFIIMYMSINIRQQPAKSLVVDRNHIPVQTTEIEKVNPTNASVARFLRLAIRFCHTEDRISVNQNISECVNSMHDNFREKMMKKNKKGVAPIDIRRAEILANNFGSRIEELKFRQLEKLEEGEPVEFYGQKIVPHWFYAAVGWKVAFPIGKEFDPDFEVRRPLVIFGYLHEEEGGSSTAVAFGVRRCWENIKMFKTWEAAEMFLTKLQKNIYAITKYEENLKNKETKQE